MKLDLSGSKFPNSIKLLKPTGFNGTIPYIFVMVYYIASWRASMVQLRCTNSCRRHIELIYLSRVREETSCQWLLLISGSLVLISVPISSEMVMLWIWLWLLQRDCDFCSEYGSIFQLQIWQSSNTTGFKILTQFSKGLFAWYDPGITRHWAPLSYRCTVADLPLFHRYFLTQLSSIIP